MLCRRISRNVGSPQKKTVSGLFAGSAGSLDNANVDHAGSVRFERATGGRGTIVRVELQYRPPADRTGAIYFQTPWQNPEKEISAGPPAVQANG